jgi:hypothetical protein
MEQHGDHSNARIMYSLQLEKFSQISIHKKSGKRRKNKIISSQREVKRVNWSVSVYKIMDNLKAEITVMKLKILL